MTHTITVGKLRQNPTNELREVREGAEYVVTDRGVPIARLVPVAQELWISPQRAATIFEVDVDQAWGVELSEDRLEVEMDDPWARSAR